MNRGWAAWIRMEETFPTQDALVEHFRQTCPDETIVIAENIDTQEISHVYLKIYDPVSDGGEKDGSK